MEFDKLSGSILKALQENARSSFAEIGRKVGLSAPAVAERIQKLEEAKVIRGYHVDIDPQKLGYTLQALIMFESRNGKSSAFAEYITTVSEVTECHRVTGTYCFVFKIAVQSSQHLDKLINSFSEYGEPTTSVILSSPVAPRIFIQNGSR
jgi:Lrp/AsnC family transcriptional regulator, leucine-responsive regulatory protein